MINITSAKTEEVAETPIKINLQLFAEGEPEPAEPSDPIEPTPEPVDPGTGAEPEPADPEPVRQTPEDNAKYAAARREAEAQAKAYKERMDNFAKMYGYNSFEEMEYATQLAQYQQQGYSEAEAERLAKLEQIEKKMVERENRARIAEEKAALKDKRFFKELEPEIDKILAANPNLSVEAVYKYVRGERLEELLEKEKAAARQKTLNNINSKQHLKTEGDGAGDADDIHIPEETLQMYLDMGMDKKQAMAHYKKLYGR